MSKNQELLDEILGILRTVMDDREKLEIIHNFFLNEIYEEPAKANLIYELKIPKKYKKIVPQIADSLNAGLVCFLNIDTLEVEDVPESLATDPDEYELMTGESFEDLDLKYLKWDNFIEIHPPGSNVSYSYMTDFAEALPNCSFKQRAFQALEQKRPFANFKYLVENSDYSQDWFDYKQNRLEEYVLEFI